MQRVTTGIAAQHDIPLIDEQGVALVATDATYRILDENGNQIVASTSVPVTDSDISVTISSSAPNNTLSGTAIRGLRVIVLTLTTSAGQKQAFYRYAVDISAGVLYVPTNSFQTYDQAILESLNHPNIDNWDAADQNARIVAMISARNTLCRLSYRQVFDNEQARLGPQFSLRDLALLTSTEFFALDAVFRATLAAAQIVEADFQIDNDSIAKSREQGLTERKVGESTDVYLKTKPFMGLASKRALQILSRYVVLGIGIGRSG